MRYVVRTFLGLITVLKLILLVASCLYPTYLSAAQPAPPEAHNSLLQQRVDSRLRGEQVKLRQIVPGVYLFKDTCNVYAVVKNDKAVLIDFGSGGILDQLPSIGVHEVGWVLHTHFHRDQTQGDKLAKNRGIKIAVPEAERKYFENVESLWNEKKGLRPI
jgi:beta-lactamase superfamily II metal-dependent hydrolase